MTRIESRPRRSGLGRYLFFVDLDGHRSDPACRGVLEALAAEVPLLKVLGSYPRDVVDLVSGSDRATGPGGMRA